MNKKQTTLQITLSAIFSIFFVVLVAQATSTIGTNFSADGTITSVGQFRASSTSLFTGIATMYNDLIVDTDTFFVDTANNRVGIGTASPIRELHISGSLNPVMMVEDTRNSVQTIIGADSSKGFMGTISSHPFQIRTGNSPLMQLDSGYDSEVIRIDSSGNVGIGTTSPLSKLHVNGEIIISNNNYISGRSHTGSSNIHMYHLSTADNQTFGDVNAGYASMDAGDFVRFRSNGSELMRLTGGKIGIGISTPAELLHVHNNTATSTMFISSGGVGLGGEIIIEDVDGAGCTEVTTLDGVISGKIVTCPTN